MDDMMAPDYKRNERRDLSAAAYPCNVITGITDTLIQARVKVKNTIS
jgi:hypothetical protein